MKERESVKTSSGNCLFGSSWFPVLYKEKRWCLFANFVTLFWHVCPFLPTRMSFPPLWWPALVCPWKSCALLRVRVKVPRSSHPQRSSIESMTLVRLPLFLLSSEFSPSLPRGNILARCSSWRCCRSIVIEMRRGQDFYYFVSERAEVLPGASTKFLQIIKSTVTSHFQYITPQFLLTPPLWLHRPQTGQHCRHQTEPWRSGRSAGSWKHLHFPCHCASGERYSTWVCRHLLSVQVSQPTLEIERENSCHLFN